MTQEEINGVRWMMADVGEVLRPFLGLDKRQGRALDRLNMTKSKSSYNLVIYSCFFLFMVLVSYTMG